MTRRAKPTPVFADDTLTAYVGDAFDIVPRIRDVLPWSHVVTDPPFDAKTHRGALSTKNDGTQNHSVIVDFDSWSVHRIRELFATTRAPRWTISSVAYQHAFALEASPPTNMQWIRMGVWVKDNYAPQLSGDRPAQGWEAVAVMHGTGVAPRWNGGGKAATWTLPGVRRSTYPTEKPEALLRSIVSLFTDPGDVILDPCCGSGTTARAAKDLGRRAVIIDTNPDAVEIAVRRHRQEVLL